MKKFLRAIVGLAAAGAVGAVVAFAILTSVQQTAPNTATARTVGAVDIGDAATVGLLSQDLSMLEPGDSYAGCTFARTSGLQTGDAAKLYAFGTPNTLANIIKVDVYTAATVPDTTGHAEAGAGTGVDACPTDATTTAGWTSKFSGTLADLISTNGSYATGWAFHNDTTEQGVVVWFRITEPAGTDPVAVMGQSTGPFGLAFQVNSAA